jgi:hypothetical protein
MNTNTPETDAFKRTVGEPWWVFAGRLERERDEARAEAAHWKSNHDNQVAIKSALIQRPDLGDRAQRIEMLIKDRATLAYKLVGMEAVEAGLRAENEEMRDVIKEAHEAIDLIHIPLGDETATSGNPCCCPNPPQGRALAAALAKLKPFLK